MSNYRVVSKDGKTVKPGDEITSFRGEPYIFCGFMVKQPPSTGYVFVVEKGVENTDFNNRSFYPSVFNLTIEEVK